MFTKRPSFLLFFLSFLWKRAWLQVFQELQGVFCKNSVLLAMEVKQDDFAVVLSPCGSTAPGLAPGDVYIELFLPQNPPPPTNHLSLPLPLTVSARAETLARRSELAAGALLPSPPRRAALRLPRRPLFLLHLAAQAGAPRSLRISAPKPPPSAGRRGSSPPVDTAPCLPDSLLGLLVSLRTRGCPPLSPSTSGSCGLHAPPSATAPVVAGAPPVTIWSFAPVP